MIDAYIQFRADPANDEVSDSLFCSRYNCALTELREAKRGSLDWAKKSLEMRRQTYAEKMTKIDQALFKKAEEGDTKAAELLYRRFDGWSPNIINQTNNFLDFASLLKAVDKKYIVRTNDTNRIQS